MNAVSIGSMWYLYLGPSYGIDSAIAWSSARASGLRKSAVGAGIFACKFLKKLKSNLSEDPVCPQNSLWFKGGGSLSVNSRRY